MVFSGRLDYVQSLIFLLSSSSCGKEIVNAGVFSAVRRTQDEKLGLLVVYGR